MAGFGEDDRPPTVAVHTIGQDLTALSLQDIDRRIGLLRDEITRLEAARSGKQASKLAADLFFKSPATAVPSKDGSAS